jgi:hypothetical protein
MRKQIPRQNYNKLGKSAGHVYETYQGSPCHFAVIFPMAQWEVAYPQDLADIRILHYLRLDQVQRDTIWESPEQMQAFIQRRDLRPSTGDYKCAIRFQF